MFHDKESVGVSSSRPPKCGCCSAWITVSYILSLMQEKGCFSYADFRGQWGLFLDWEYKNVISFFFLRLTVTRNWNRISLYLLHSFHLSHLSTDSQKVAGWVCVSPGAVKKNHSKVSIFDNCFLSKYHRGREKKRRIKKRDEDKKDRLHYASGCLPSLARKREKGHAQAAECEAQVQ